MSALTTRAFLLFRRPLIAGLHAVLIAAAWYGAFALRFDFSVEEPFRSAMLTTFPVVIISKFLLFYGFGLFQGWWKYAGLSDLIDIGLATVSGGVLAATLTAMTFGLLNFPRSVFLVDMVLTFLFVGGVRFVVRAYVETFRTTAARHQITRVLVVGAGRSGTALVREMRTNEALACEPVGYVDDDRAKLGLKLHGVKVRGTSSEIGALVKRFEVDQVLLAVPSMPGSVVRQITDAAQSHGATVKIMPRMGDLIDGRISVSHIREVRIEDLLGREAVPIDLTKVHAHTEGHIVMVTGAAGSIGSELSRQLARMAPGHLILFERNESDLHDLELELRQTWPNVELTAVIGDILDVEDLAMTFKRFRPSRVYHAAAYKHVGLMERHIALAVRNNVIGTYNVATMAQRHGAEQCVLISTDKAVRPTSLMGATKRAAERVLLSMANEHTRFAAVRFGNVLGSRGSVVPTFTRQIANGGPVTVTHPDVVRFFMTIPEAVQLVLQSAAMSSGGEIFHLDMGEPVRIADLAANMIRLSGFEPGRDIEIKFVGLRSGEKLYEELLIDGEEVAPTSHPRIRAMRSVDPGVDRGWIEAVIARANARDTTGLVALIQSAVPEYTPSDLVLRRSAEFERAEQGPLS